MIHTLIMAGGVGSRFWPKSRAQKPKQFLNLVGETSLIRQTYDRIVPLGSADNTLVITNDAYCDMVAEEIPELPNQNIIGEVVGRNTAPCVALAAAVVSKKDPEGVIVVLPSDHFVRNEDKYREIISSAAKKAAEGSHLLTVGIAPNRPETGYGYIQYNDKKKTDSDGNPVYLVKTFAEKPDLETAMHFLNSGDFLWNSGMFVWRADTILNEFKKWLPEIHKELELVTPHLGTKNQKAAIDRYFSRCISISVDYGIMEKTDAVHVIPGDFGWSDVGSWMAVYELAEKDNTGNVLHAKKPIVVDSQNCYLESNSEKLIGLVGLQGLTVVETDDALLICRSDASQSVKDLYNALDTDAYKTYK